MPADGAEKATASAEADSRSPLRSFGIAIAFLAAYLGLEWVGFIHEYKGLPITPWNPGLGVVFAFIVLAGARAGAVLFAGMILSDLLFLPDHGTLTRTLAKAVIVAASYSIAAQVAGHSLRLDARLIRLRDILILLGTGLAGAAAVAVLETTMLMISDQIAFEDITRASIPLLVGDAIGIAVITPLLLRVVHRSHWFEPGRTAARLVEAAISALVIVAALWAITGIGTIDGSRVFYVLFLPVVATAVRHGIDGACLALAAVQVGLVALLHAHGYDAREFTQFQVLMLVLTAAGLIVGVVVTERRNAEHTLRDAQLRLKAREAEAAQAARFSLVSSMASGLAHEISQPLAAARALARAAQHILSSPDGDRARAERNLATLVAQIDHAGGVVARIREFLRRGEPHVASIEVPAMLRDAAVLIEAEAGARGIRIAIETGQDLPTLTADRVQIQQVVLNLARNAIEAISGAAMRDGAVRIAASRCTSPPAIEIAVLDNGPGIAPDLAPRLFQPLATSKAEGLGLGLAICSSIIESHGGRIWLQSSQPGATEFRFRLPAGQEQAEPS